MRARAYQGNWIQKISRKERGLHKKTSLHQNCTNWSTHFCHRNNSDTAHSQNIPSKTRIIYTQSSLCRRTILKDLQEDENTPEDSTLTRIQGENLVYCTISIHFFAMCLGAFRTLSVDVEGSPLYSLVLPCTCKCWQNKFQKVRNVKNPMLWAVKLIKNREGNSGRRRSRVLQLSGSSIFLVVVVKSGKIHMPEDIRKWEILTVAAVP